MTGKLDQNAISQTLTQLCGDVMLLELLFRGIQERANEVCAFGPGAADQAMLWLLDSAEGRLRELTRLLEPEEGL